MNYDQMTISEMEELYNELGKEIEKRKEAETREDWRKLIDQIRLFIERHGEIIVVDETNEEHYVDCETNFDYLGIIYLPKL